MYADYLQKRVEFCHRANDDGTFDSICMRCFDTAGSAKIEEALARLEREHLCYRFTAERFNAFSRE